MNSITDTPNPAGDGTPARDAIVLVIDPDPQTGDLLEKQLDASRIRVHVVTNLRQLDELDNLPNADLIVVDFESIDAQVLEQIGHVFTTERTPIIGTATKRSPRLIDNATQLKATGLLYKPLDGIQLQVAVRGALMQRGVERAFADRVENLRQALDSSRETSVAIGILMERHCLSNEEAFDRLRTMSRSSRRRVTCLAQDIIKASENLNFNQV